MWTPGSDLLYNEMLTGRYRAAIGRSLGAALAETAAKPGLLAHGRDAVTVQLGALRPRLTLSARLDQIKPQQTEVVK